MTAAKVATLSEFLLARIAEDEDAALGAVDRDWPQYGYFTPNRVLAECAAKRRIVEEVTETSWLARDPVLRLLALPYADHEDYDESWRP